MQSHICTRWTRLLGGWTSSFSASHDGCAPGLPGQDARQWGSRSGFSLSQGPEEHDRPDSTRHQSDRPSHQAFDVQPDSVGAPHLAHDDGDGLHFYTGFYTPLRQIGICILNYLDYWLILAQSQAVLSSHKTLLLSHLDCLGLSVNFAKSILSPSFVPGHSYRLSADDSKCLSGASHNNSAPRGLLQGRYRPSAQSFPENAGPYGSGFSGTPIRSATYATHPVLAEAEGYIRGLASRTPSRNGDLGLCISPGPLEGPLLAKARRDPRHGAQKESCHDRCFQQGLGSAVRGQTDLRPLVRRGVGPAHQLPRNASSVSGLSIIPARHSGTPCASTLRQQVRSVIHK